MTTGDMKQGVKAYYDLVENDRSKKYAIIRMATAEEVAAEMQRRDCELLVSKTLVIREGYAPGGYMQGAYNTKPELIRGQHELEEVPQIV